MSRTKTLRVKVRPDSWGWLNEAAREVNMVWNHVNALCERAARPYYGPGRWLSAFDVDKLLSGTAKHLDFLLASTVTEIIKEHGRRRSQVKRVRLSWRKSGGSRRSLGWLPFRTEAVKSRCGAVVYRGRRFRIFDSYGLENYELRSGCFAQNALGEWFLNVVVRVPVEAGDLPERAVGIDLGLKDIATTSDGATLPAGRWYRDAEAKLAQAQRRGHKRQAKRIQQDAANRRKDALHKFSSAMVRDYGAIYIGDVSSQWLVKTRAAKSVLDSGWGMLKTMLQHKGHLAGRVVEVVDEKFTTQACADCGSLTGPKGRTGLVVRRWVCSACGTEHQRDINAARNIVARGLLGSVSGNQREGPATAGRAMGRKAQDSQPQEKNHG